VLLRVTVALVTRTCRTGGTTHGWFMDKAAIETETSTGDVVKKYRDIDMDKFQ